MPFFFCIYFLQKNKHKDLKVFFIYTILLFLSIVVLITLRYILHSYSTYLIYNRIYLITEFSLISYFFSYNIIDKKIKKIIQLLIFPFAIFSIYDYISTINQSFTYYPVVFECILFPIIIFLFLYEKMKYISKSPVYVSPGFWIAIAFLLYSTGNFFLFLFSKLLLQDLHNKSLYNNIYGFFTLLKDILLCIAIVVSKKPITADLNPNVNLNPIQTTTLPLFTKYT